MYLCTLNLGVESKCGTTAADTLRSTRFLTWLISVWRYWSHLEVIRTAESHHNSICKDGPSYKTWSSWLMADVSVIVDNASLRWSRQSNFGKFVNAHAEVTCLASLSNNRSIIDVASRWCHWWWNVSRKSNHMATSDFYAMSLVSIILGRNCLESSQEIFRYPTLLCPKLS